MDVNATMARLRDAMEAMASAEDWDALTEASQDAQECFQSLDEWLSKGGFLPAERERKA